MFGKLFKKTKVLVIEDNSIANIRLDATVIKGKYSEDVEQIHHEFNTAADNLLIEAKSIIDEANTKDVKKVNRLEALGFKQAGQVIELKPLIQKAQLSKEQIELLAYYQLNYPNNKFITEEQVKTICHKYNLVCGDVNRFKGFVPEKNLKEIEKFKLKGDDGKEIVYKYGSTIQTLEEWYTQHTKPWVDRNVVVDGRKSLGASKSFQICAPIKDMDISGLELEEGYKLKKKLIPDPVVLQPVKGGYLILTAWGDEASDELVVNQKFN